MHPCSERPREPANGGIGRSNGDEKMRNRRSQPGAWRRADFRPESVNFGGGGRRGSAGVPDKPVVGLLGLAGDATARFLDLLHEPGGVSFKPLTNRGPEFMEDVHARIAANGGSEIGKYG